MLTTIGAVLSLLATIAGIIAWYVKRKRAPTKAEQIFDLHEKYTDTIENVHRLRAEGKNAEAEELLRRLRSRATSGRSVNELPKSP